MKAAIKRTIPVNIGLLREMARNRSVAEAASFDISLLPLLPIGGWL
jgi:hypothetical protein